MRKLLSLFLCTSLSLAAAAQSKLSAYSLNYLQTYNASAATSVEVPKHSMTRIRTIDVAGKPTVLAFVTVESADRMPNLSGYEATVEASQGNILVVRVPVENIRALAADDLVKRVSIERPLKHRNNLTRERSLVDEVHATLDAAGNAIKGKDVVVGIIDTGIDFNHITFKDSEGNSRVKQAINGNKKYTTASTIASLTTDNTTEDHGTHVASIAAGSFTANGYYGMAPEADLVLCGLKYFSDAALISACQFIIDYAKSEQKPCVINMSIGHNSGPHDGSDEFNVMLEGLAEEGVVFSVASGNEGDMQIYLDKKFHAEEEQTDSVKTIIADYYYGGDYYEYSNVEIWNFQEKVPELEFYVVDATTNNILMTSERIALPFDKSETTWQLSSTSQYTNFKQYYTTGYASPNISVTMKRGSGYGSVSIMVNGESRTTGKYYVAMGVFGENDMEIHAWGADSYAEFRQNGSTKFTAGDASKSFNPMCIGDNIVSVGAWNTRNSYKSLNGRNYSYSEYGKVGDISSFSSYGEGFHGDAYPDVCAPGLTIFSAFNTYHKAYNTDKTEYVDVQTVNGKNYYWGQMSGTSMATPAVTGMIALWLQVNPNLTGADVRQIINQTAKKDSYVTDATTCCWGAGKIDAYAGLQAVMESGVDEVAVMQNQVLIYPNPNGGQFKVFTQGEYQGATLSVFGASGALLHSQPISAASQAVDIDLSGKLLPGIYVVNVAGCGVNYSTRMIIK